MGVIEYIHETELLAISEDQRLNDILSSSSKAAKTTKTVVSKIFNEYFLLQYKKLLTDEHGLSYLLDESKRDVFVIEIN